MLLRRVAVPLLRFAFHLFYNPFAFTYDFVSEVVSRGRWRAWTRQAVPRVSGTRVLEVPCGTGNLELDLAAAGYRPVAVDLSIAMLNITRGKLRKAGLDLRLLRARVEALPFAAQSFDTVIMTFPPEFIYDPRTFAEFRRVLADQGCLVWVDAGRMLPRDVWGRLLNGALDAVGGGGNFESMAHKILVRAGFEPQIEWVQDDWSVVAVVTARKGST
jgi:ubiquinone/menaquinone biosynthesis C-methylase UbiE